MRTVLALAAAGVLASGAVHAATKRAAKLQEDTTCQEWTNAVVAGYLFDKSSAIDFAKQILTAAELTHIRHGEPGLFSKAPPETATDIAVEAGRKCMDHPEVKAFVALGVVYERKRGELLGR